MIVSIIPVYNEEADIKSLLEKTRAKMAEMGEEYCLLVVDDGSTDGTRRILDDYRSRMPIEIIFHPKNMGVGEAFRTGFRHALGLVNDNDVIVTKEADNTSDLDILPEMIGRIRQGYDLVLASCYAKGGRMEDSPFFRHFLSVSANLFIKIIFGFKELHTFSSFYRAYNPRLIHKAFEIYKEKFIVQLKRF